MPANTAASVPFQPHLASVDIVTLNGEISQAFQLKCLSSLRIGDTQASPGERLDIRAAVIYLGGLV